MKIFKILLIIVFVLLLSAAVLAEDKVYEKTSNGLTFTVTYPETITCGEPTVFHFSASGGSGNYKYRIYSLTEADNTSVYDVSWGSNSSYFTLDSWSFTFYASGTYYIRFSVFDCETYKTVSTDIYGMVLVIDDKNYPSVDERVQSIVDECLAQNLTTEYDKALWLHDKLIGIGSYDNSYSYCSAEGVLARGKGTCESYHRAYVKLLDAVGISTKRVTGGGHVWTGACLDGEWTQIDATWDDPGYTSTNPALDYQHLYFGLTDEIMASGHGYSSNADIPYTSLERNYYIRSGLIEKTAASYRTTANAKRLGGELSFSLDFSMTCDNVLGSLTAYTLGNCVYSDKKLVFDYSAMPDSFDVTLPNSITRIPEEAYMNDVSFSTVWLPDGCVSIGARAFAGIGGLIVRVPAGVAYIGENAFDAGTVIIGSSDSYASDWAEENLCEFVASGE